MNLIRNPGYACCGPAPEIYQEVFEMTRIVYYREILYYTEILYYWPWGHGRAPQPLISRVRPLINRVMPLIIKRLMTILMEY